LLILAHRRSRRRAGRPGRPSVAGVERSARRADAPGPRGHGRAPAPRARLPARRRPL
jgi:hypothetical protein